MTKKPAKKPANNDAGGFINITLDEEEQAMANAWCETDEQLFEALTMLCNTPFTLKVAIEPQNNCYGAYIQGHWKLNEFDKKWTLTGRGSTPKKAIRRALYLHFEHLQQEWSDHKAVASRPRDWD